MADDISIDEIRAYCERVVKSRQRHSFGVKPETVAQTVLDLLDEGKSSDLSHNVFEDSAETRAPNVFVHPKNQIGGKRR